MSKWFRGAVISCVVCLLLAGGALAGPTRIGDGNGDPDRPEIAVPVDRLSASTGSADSTRDASVTSRTERAPSELEVLVRVYLKLFRIFLR
jgi:hypothetical protein